MRLEISGVDVFYGEVQALRGVSFSVEAGEVLCLIGRNGAGKTTALKAVMGLVPVRTGAVLLDGSDLARLPPHLVPRQGVGYVPQGRRLFGELTVAENLEIGLMAGNRSSDAKAHVFELFPVLAERLDQPAGTLSGGEQQMLAMGRALCLAPGLLLLDEPTEGLQPSMITRIRNVVAKLRTAGTAVILVEQRIEAVRGLADRVTFFEHGRSVETADRTRLDAEPDLLARYVGLGAA